MSRTRQALVALLSACCAALAVFVIPTTSGTLTRTITNSSNSAKSGIVNGPCTSTATATGSAYFVWPLDDAPAAPAAWDSSRNSRPGTYVNIPQITYGAAGPCPKDNARAVTLSGGTNGGYVTLSTAAIVNPTTFSTAIWFKTSTTAGGKLIGFGSSQTGASGQYDRHIYMGTNGILYAGVYYLSTVRTVQSTAAYNDNTWHLAVMTLSPSVGATVGLRLYVDGSLVASDATVLGAENTTGYWRVGYDNLSGWTNSPANYWFGGSIAFASVYTAALTAAQVTALNSAGR